MEFEYIRDADKLMRIIKTVSLHEAEVKQYYFSHLRPRVANLGNVKDRLVVLFAIANKQRRGIGKGNEKLVNAAVAFYQGVDQKVEICSGLDPKEAHQIYLEWLCDIQGMNQKTANLFLKWLGMFHDDFGLDSLDWQSWEPYLHVPLDMWVMRLIGEGHFDVCTSNYEHDFRKAKGERDYLAPGVKNRKYAQLQSEFAEVASLAQEPRITLDVLWFVGNMYCAYHPLLCSTCWIEAGDCKKHPTLDLSSLSVSSKSERRKARTRARKQAITKLREMYPEEWDEIKKKYGLLR